MILDDRTESARGHGELRLGAIFRRQNVLPRISEISGLPECLPGQDAVPISEMWGLCHLPPRPSRSRLRPLPAFYSERYPWACQLRTLSLSQGRPNAGRLDLFDRLFDGLRRLGSFFGLDVIVSSIVLWTLVFIEGRLADIKYFWAPIVANLAVGVSLGLPLFLYMHERRLGER